MLDDGAYGTPLSPPASLSSENIIETREAHVGSAKVKRASVPPGSRKLRGNAARGPRHEVVAVGEDQAFGSFTAGDARTDGGGCKAGYTRAKGGIVAAAAVAAVCRFRYSAWVYSSVRETNGNPDGENSLRGARRE